MSGTTARQVVVFITDPVGYAVPLEWLEDYGRGHQMRLDVVVAGSDNPGAPQFVSPRAKQALEEALQASGCEFSLSIPTAGAAEVVLRLAASIDPDLIVVNVSARSATGKLVLGSQARRVVTEATRPVLTIKSGRM